MSRGGSVALVKGCEPDEVAHVVLSLCAEGARSIHGQAIAVDGGQVMS